MKKFLLSLAACLAFGVSANAELVTDVLTPESLQLDGNSAYKDYTYKGTSGAEYALQCSNGTEIQLRSTNPSGIVVTKSAGKVTKVEVVWNGSTSSSGNRTLNVYGSETAYTAPADLYAADANKLGGITCGSQTEFTLTTPAPYIGLRSDSGAMYITSISITWDADGSAGGETPEQPDPDQPDPDQPENPDSEAGEFTIVWADQGYANGTALETFTKDGITYAFSKGSNNNPPAYYNTGTAIRLYGGNTMTLSVGKGYLISKVEFTVGGSNPFNSESKASVGTLDAENAVWTSTEGAQSVTFTQGGTSGHVRIEKMVITVIAGEGGETPEEPDPDQPTVPTDAISVAEALSMIAAGSTATVKVQGIITSITEVSTNYGNATYEIKDAVSDAKGLTVYRGYWLNGEKFTAENQIAVGGKVVVEGALLDYNGTPELNSGNKILSYEAPQQGEIPEPEVPTGDSVTFNFTDPDSLGIEFVPEQQENNLTGISITSGIVTLSFENNGGTTEPRLWYASNGYTMRFYKDNEFTVSAAENYVLTGVEFDGTNIGKNWTWSSGSLISNTWIPEADSETSSVVFGKSATGDNPTVRKMTVYYDRPTGVDSIMTEEGEAVYYNLQGVRVNNPERGIFIKVVGNKAVKVVK